MPRTVQQILEQADELATRFDEHQPGSGGLRDARELRHLRGAFQKQAEAERDLSAAVESARGAGHSWGSIGAMIGTSGEAARQRYGRAAVRSRK